MSDLCTVFMERDMNHYLSEGYAVEEVLASVLHPVRENYLTKVAVEGGIGDRIFFQGATAKTGPSWPPSSNGSKNPSTSPGTAI